MDANYRASQEYTLGQVGMLQHFAMVVMMLPIEPLLQRLDLFEQSDEHKGSDAYAKAIRMRDRDVAAVLLDCKRQLLALHAAYMHAQLGIGVVRDSRPPFPAPIDPRPADVRGDGAAGRG